MEQPSSISSKDILTPEEAAEVLRVHPDTVRCMCKDGRLPCLRLGAKDSKRAIYRIPAWRLIETLNS